MRHVALLWMVEMPGSRRMLLPLLPLLSLLPAVTAGDSYERSHDPDDP
eukprot:gene3335-10728_t